MRPESLRLGRARPDVCLFLVALASTATGCRHAERASHELFSSSTAERVVSRADYEVAWTWGSEEDTVLLAPRLIVAAKEGGVFVFDDVSGRVTFFDEAGHPQWHWGGRGRGPSEFDNVRDMTLNDLGELVVLDSGNRRLVKLSAGGSLLDQVTIPDVGYVDQVVPLPSSGYLLITYGTPTVVHLAPGGRIEGSFDLPWEHYAELSAVERQGSVADFAGKWVYGFKMGNGWFSFAGVDSIGVFPYVEHTPFPLVSRDESGGVRRTQILENVCSACSLALRADTLVVHFGGATEGQFSLLDRYALSTGHYLGTRRLPIRASNVAIGHDVVFALDIESLFPRLVALRPSSILSIASQGTH